MATATPAYFALTGDTNIDAMTNGSYWALGADNTIDWSISAGWSVVNFSNPGGMVMRIQHALDIYASYANIHFNYIGDFADPGDAAAHGSEINVALDYNFIIHDPQIWGKGFFPLPDAMVVDAPYVGVQGDVYLNSASQASDLSYEPGASGWTLLLHELGHALGLKHPSDSGGTGRPSVEQQGRGDLDWDFFSLMSNNQSYGFDLLGHNPATPMQLDVLALQYLYGPNMSTFAGNTQYHLSSSSAYTTYWDASGIDTVYAPTDAVDGWEIDLPYAQVTPLVPTISGSATPLQDHDTYETLTWLMGNIENAVGSNAGDSLYGNALDNVLTGAGGNDTLNGDTGFDYAQYSGPRSSYATHRDGDSVVVQALDSNEGTDNLYAVEALKFSDVSVALLTGTNAGQAVKLIGSVVGDATVDNPQVVGVVMHLLESGMSEQQVADLGLNVMLGDTRSDATVFSLLYAHLFHAAPNADAIALGAELLGSGQFTQASLAVFASEMQPNLQNIGFAGLIDNGIAFDAAQLG